MSNISYEQLDSERAARLVDLYKAFGDSTRLKILSYLLEAGSKCVSDIAWETGMTVSAVSHQLRLLRQTKLISAVRIGKNIYYAIADEHVKSILEIAIEHVLEE